MTKRSLQSLLAAIDYQKTNVDGSIEIKGVATDSREVFASYVFVAIPGTVADGYDFIPQAVDQGASVIISERTEKSSLSSGKITWIQVKDARKIASLVAEWFYGYPSQQLKLIGVTGTNGKSSVVYMLHQLFENLGYRAGMFSTIVNKNHQEEMPARLTTPDPVSLSRDLSEMVGNGCDYAFMEVSSHALEQRRVYALDFDGGVYTNITHDHLDYHGTFINYMNAKKLFFDQLGPKAFALINEDDRSADYMVQNTKAVVRTFGLKSLADYRCQILDMDVEAMTIRLDGKEILTRVTGQFNAYNLLAVYGVAHLCGLGREEEVMQGLSLLHGVPGRFERVIVDGGGPVGIVDYAHTPDAVEKVTQAAAGIVRGAGRILIALGCGGNRDRDKRPAMARAAAQNADIVILTSDNPRGEDPQQIISEMYEGLIPALKAKAFRIEDRREAIRMAVSMAHAGDIVIVAGKGHEQYQEIQGKKYPFNDRIELENALSQKIKR